MILYNLALAYRMTLFGESTFSMMLMKGTPPTPAELISYENSTNKLLRTYDLLQDRDADKLFRIYSNVSGWTDHIANVAKPGAITMTTQKLGNHTSSDTYFRDGEATWFVLGERRVSIDASSGHMPVMAVVGTVSDLSGNGDVKLSKTQIDASTDFGLNNLVMNFDPFKRMHDATP